MISPHTPPGTKVVCIAEPIGFVRAFDLRKIENRSKDVEVGKIYTVSKVIEIYALPGTFAVNLVEFGDYVCFSLNLFRYLELPKVLTDIAAGAPVDPSAVEEPRRTSAKPLRRSVEEWR